MARAVETQVPCLLHHIRHDPLGLLCIGLPRARLELDHHKQALEALLNGMPTSLPQVRLFFTWPSLPALPNYILAISTGMFTLQYLLQFWVWLYEGVQENTEDWGEEIARTTYWPFQMMERFGKMDGATKIASAAKSAVASRLIKRSSG